VVNKEPRKGRLGTEVGEVDYGLRNDKDRSRTVRGPGKLGGTGGEKLGFLFCGVGRGGVYTERGGPIEYKLE